MKKIILYGILIIIVASIAFAVVSYLHGQPQAAAAQQNVSSVPTLECDDQSVCDMPAITSIQPSTVALGDYIYVNGVLPSSEDTVTPDSFWIEATSGIYKIEESSGSMPALYDKLSIHLGVPVCHSSDSGSDCTYALSLKPGDYLLYYQANGTTSNKVMFSLVAATSSKPATKK